MTWRVAPYDRAVEEAEHFIRASWTTRGVIVGGSIVRGEASPTSDLDIVVVHAEPWRVRTQRRFAGVPAELFVNPPDRIRGYFESEHRSGTPTMAHMIATGEVLAGDEVVAQLVHEAREWLAKPIAPTPAELASKRYAAVDTLDDARDALPVDPTMAALLLATAVQQIAACVFWQHARFQPRRKHLIRALDALDPIAADLLRAFARASGADGLRIACTLANHVLGVDTFFEWASDPDPPRSAGS